MKSPTAIELYETLGSLTWLPRIFSKRCFSSTGVNCVDKKEKAPVPPPEVLAPEHPDSEPAKKGATVTPAPSCRARRREMCLV